MWKNLDKEWYIKAQMHEKARHSLEQPKYIITIITIVNMLLPIAFITLLAAFLTDVFLSVFIFSC